MSANSTKVFSWKAAVLLSLGTGLLVAGLSVFLQTQSQTKQVFPLEDIGPVAENVGPTAEDSKPGAAAPAALGLGSSFEMPGQPVQLRIPAIGVDAKIQSVGLSLKGDGTIGIPTNFTDVAWYNLGPRPGMPGSAVIDGHLDGKKVKEAVFYDLGKLKLGDLVEVVGQAGKTMQFRVVDSKIYDYDAVTTDVFSNDTSKARLNLITCAGSWIKSQKLYNKRVVVFTELVTTD